MILSATATFRVLRAIFICFIMSASMLLTSSTVGRALKLSSFVTRIQRPVVSSLSSSRRFASTANSNPDSAKRYLQVPFDQKDEVKALGARWDKDAKKWFVPENAFSAEFQRWLPKYLNVPFAERNEAKTAGALWDAAAQQWYVPSNITNTAPFEKWMNTQTNTPQTAAKTAKAPTAAKVFPPSHQSIVILDLDTNGLPIQTKGKNVEFTDLISYDPARIVQLSYALCDIHSFEKIEGGTFIIKSDGFTIDNQRFHGITLAKSLKEGITFKEAAEKVMSVVDKADYVIAHNANFDLNIFKSELFRYGLFDMLKSLGNRKELCSMLMTTPLLGLLDKIGNPKPPTLKELVKFALNEALPDPHAASVDVELVRRSLQKLVEANKVVISDSVVDPKTK